MANQAVSKHMSITSIRTLRLLMPLSAVGSSLTQLAAILTNHWLFTMELMPNEKYERFKMPPEMEYLRKYTESGMLQLCQNTPPKSEMHCAYIDYLSKEEYIPDQNDSTMAIPYSMRRAAWYIVSSVLILLLGELLYLCRKVCGRRRQICTFIAGIAFILAGLTILAGLVVYISTFKGEVSNKLRPLSEFQDALFHYRYGGSFLLLVASLLLCEVTGTLAVFLYIAQRKFKIDIDTEREEVLKRNLLSLMLPDLKGISVDGGGDPKRTSHDSAITRVQPMLRIVCEDEDGVPVPAGPIAFATTSPVVDHNFLSAEFGLSDPSMYFYGRHGSRGRRNSRSNESFLGSSPGGGSERDRSSRKNSFTSAADEREHEQQHQLPAPPPPPPPPSSSHPPPPPTHPAYQNQNHPNLKKTIGNKSQKSVDLPAITVGRHHSPPPLRNSITTTSTSFHPQDSLDCPPGLLELHVPSLQSLQNFRQPPPFKPVDHHQEPPLPLGGKQTVYPTSSSSKKAMPTNRFQTRYSHPHHHPHPQPMLMRSESEEMVEGIPYFLPLSNLEATQQRQSNNLGNHSSLGTNSREQQQQPSRNRLTKQMSLNINNPNRSTYV